MAVKIRMSRSGRKHVPVYRIVAVDSRAQRDGEYLENLGSYDPVKGIILQFKEERILDWVSKGAIVTDCVKKLHRKYTRAKGGQAVVKTEPKKQKEMEEVALEK